MSNPHPQTRSGRRGKAAGLAKDYRLLQAETDPFPGNLKLLGVIIGGAISFLAILTALFGRRAVSQAGSVYTTGLKQEISYKVFIELYQDEIIKFRPALARHKLLPAQLNHWAENGKTILLCQVKTKKGQKPGLSHYVQGALQAGPIRNEHRFFHIAGCDMRFELTDIRNVIKANGITCLVVADPC